MHRYRNCSFVYFVYLIIRDLGFHIATVLALFFCYLTHMQNSGGILLFASLPVQCSCIWSTFPSVSIGNSCCINLVARFHVISLQIQSKNSWVSYIDLCDWAYPVISIIAEQARGEREKWPLWKGEANRWFWNLTTILIDSKAHFSVLLSMLSITESLWIISATCIALLWVAFNIWYKIVCFVFFKKRYFKAPLPALNNEKTLRNLKSQVFKTYALRQLIFFCQLLFILHCKFFTSYPVT